MPRYAAIDIGSNSIRMAAAEVLPGERPRTLAADREVRAVVVAALTLLTVAFVWFSRSDVAACRRTRVTSVLPRPASSP